MKTGEIKEYIIAKIKDLVSYFFCYFSLLYVILIFCLLTGKNFNENASSAHRLYLISCLIIPLILGCIDFFLLWFRKGKEVEYPEWWEKLFANLLFIAFFFNLYLLYVYS